MPRLDSGTYGSVVSEVTALQKGDVGSSWDWRRPSLVVSLALFLAALVAVIRFHDHELSLPAATLDDESFGRALIGVLTHEGLGVAFHTVIHYECLARMTGRKLVLVPLVSEHFDLVPIDLGEIIHVEGGTLVPLTQAPDNILDKAWDQYVNGEWVRGGDFPVDNTYYTLSRGGSATIERTVWQCGEDSRPCAKEQISQVTAKADDPIVTVFAQGDFCTLLDVGMPQTTLWPPDNIYNVWVAATEPHFKKGSGLSTLHWRRGDRCTKKQIFEDREGREFPCSDVHETPVPEMCKSHAPLYVATDDFDDDFQAALLNAGCLTFPQVFGDVGVTDAFGLFMLDIMTIAKRTEKKFFVLGGSTDNAMMMRLQAAMGYPIQAEEITPEGLIPFGG